jgi:riboflavin biosynthesis pyrimidine reductase
MTPATEGSAVADRIDRLFPEPVAAATDEQVLDWYATPTGVDRWVSFNFVSSLDGTAVYRGRSGTLGSAAVQRIFKLLRRQADVVLVGAQTVRVEGYSGQLVDAAAQQWRRRHGLAAHPALAVVSGTLNLEPDSALFTDAPVRPLLITTASADAGRRTSLEEVADVIIAGEQTLDVERLTTALADRGLHRIHSEGGPRLFGTFQEAGRVDELCLSLSPLLVGGNDSRISAGAAELPAAGYELRQVLRAGSMLFMRYLATPSS